MERFAASSFSDFYGVKELHRSQTGAVYSAFFKFDKKRYVLKERKIPELGKSKNIMNEVVLLQQLSHPNVVRCEGYFRDEQRKSLFIVLEFCDGGDLFALLKQYRIARRSLSEPHIWHIFYQLCDGLKHLHESGIVHRDLKTMNVMCIDGGQVIKIADLGVSRQLSDETLMLDTFYGTPLYLSPELVESKAYNEKTDIWSLGVILYEMAALTTPFKGRTLLDLGKLVMAGKYEPIPSGYSQHLSKCIRWMLSADMTQRPNIVQLLRFVDQRREASFRVRSEALGELGGAAWGGAGVDEEKDPRPEERDADTQRDADTKSQKISRNKVNVSGSAAGTSTAPTAPAAPTVVAGSSAPTAPAPPTPSHPSPRHVAQEQQAKPLRSTDAPSAAQVAEIESRFGDRLHITLPARPSPLDQPQNTGYGQGSVLLEDGTKKRIAGVGGWKADGSDMPSTEDCKDGLNSNSQHGKVLATRRRGAHPPLPEVDVISHTPRDRSAVQKASVKQKQATGDSNAELPDEAAPLSLAPPAPTAAKTVTIATVAAGPQLVAVDQQRISNALRRESCCLRKLLQARDFLSNPTSKVTALDNKDSDARRGEAVGEGRKEEVAAAEKGGEGGKPRRRHRPKEVKAPEETAVDVQVRQAQRRIKLLEQAQDSGMVDANSDECAFMLATRAGGLAMSPSREALLQAKGDEPGLARRRGKARASFEDDEKPAGPRFLIVDRKQHDLPTRIDGDFFEPEPLKTEIQPPPPRLLQKAASQTVFKQAPSKKSDLFVKVGGETPDSREGDAAVIPSAAGAKLSSVDAKRKVVRLEYPPLSEVIAHNRGEVQAPFVRHDYRDHVEAHPRVKTPRQEEPSVVERAQKDIRPRSAVVHSRQGHFGEVPRDKILELDNLYEPNGLRFRGLYRDELKGEAYASKELLPAAGPENDEFNHNANHPRNFRRKALVSSGDAHRGQEQPQGQPKKRGVSKRLRELVELKADRQEM